MQGSMATVVRKASIASVQLFCLQPGALFDERSRLPVTVSANGAAGN